MRSGLPPDILKLAEQQVVFCKVFSNTARVLILWLLAERKRTAIELAFTIGISRQELLKNLQVMNYRNLVVSSREENNIYYYIRNNEEIGICPILSNRPLNQVLEVPVI